MDDSEPPSGGRPGHPRREFLAAVGTATVAGVAGCSLLPARGIALEWADGASACVEPIERDRPVTEFYGYDPALGRAADRDLWKPGRTTTFLYRNAATGQVSLCVVNGAPHPDRMSDGRAVLTVEGAGGSEWQVLDDPADDPDGNDVYGTPTGELGASETVVWDWPNDETDGAAIGPLQREFALTLRHRGTATIGGTTVERAGLDLWTFLDGADPKTPIEVGRFESLPGPDVSIRVATGTC